MSESSVDGIEEDHVAGAIRDFILDHSNETNVG
jgi:hypothetical protein